MKNRVNKALRYIDEYLNGRRYNPRLCLTVEEAEIVSKKGNLVSKVHLYMWKIRQF